MPLLPARQEWLLVDWDPALLDVARRRLADWADRTRDEGPRLIIEKDGRSPLSRSGGRT